MGRRLGVETWIMENDRKRAQQPQRDEAIKKIFGGSVLKWGSLPLWGMFLLKLSFGGLRPWPFLLGVSFIASLWWFMGSRGIRQGRAMLARLDAELKQIDPS